MKRLVLLLSVLLGSARALAVTIDPQIFFAYSQPYHGNQTLFLSHRACSVNTNGISAALLSQFGVDAPDAATQRWSHGMVNSPRWGVAYEECWVSVMKDSQRGVLSCVVKDGQISKNCTVFAKSFFLDTRDLPRAPRRPEF
ncbi:hypothetical protein ACI2S3_02860 [Ralstonia nicotianae]